MNKYFKFTALFFAAAAIIYSLFSLIYYRKENHFENFDENIIIGEDSVAIGTENSENNAENNIERQADTNESVSANTNELNESDYENSNYKIQALVNLNVRISPSKDSKIIGILYANEKVTYADTTDSKWHRIFFKGKAAYVSADLNYSRKIDISYTNTIDNIIDIGYTLLGTPYEYGSQRLLLYSGKLNPDFTGNTFDCSAFVQYIFYKGAGIKLYGDSRSQSSQGKDVAMSDLQKGDVLFMTSSSRLYNTGIEKIGHVAVYIGSNKIMHTFGTGGVRIQEFSDFWKGRFIKAKRML